MVIPICPFVRMSQLVESLLGLDIVVQQQKINLRQDIGRAKNGN